MHNDGKKFEFFPKYSIENAEAYLMRQGCYSSIDPNENVEVKIDNKISNMSGKDLADILKKRLLINNFEFANYYNFFLECRSREEEEKKLIEEQNKTARLLGGTLFWVHTSESSLLSTNMFDKIYISFNGEDYHVSVNKFINFVKDEDIMLESLMSSFFGDEDEDYNLRIDSFDIKDQILNLNLDSY